MKRLVIARRISQLSFFALFVYILWSTTYPLKGVLPPETFFKTDPLLVMMTSLSARVILPGFGFALGMLALTFIFGRFFCGWICPLGASIDAAGALRRRRANLTDSRNRALRQAKFYILLAIGAIAVFGRQVAWVLDPIALTARFVSLNLIPAATASLNAVFVFLIRDIGIDARLRDLYRALKPSLLGVKAVYFSHAGVIFAYFILVIAMSLVISRFWCRSLCPLGALYAFFARFAGLGRIVDECKKCRRCTATCRTGAIRRDLSYAKGECVLCMDCVYTCPVRGVKFGFNAHKGPEPEGKGVPQGGGISRKEFLVFIVSSLALLGFKSGRDTASSAGTGNAIIRPPAALDEKDFIDRCVRCGNCMKVCITNGLQPAMLEAGYGGVWTPRLIPEIGYCEYRCTLCGDTCPTGAIPRIGLETKMKTRLGVAEVDKALCIPYAKGKECIVCQEHCPVAEKAIALDRDERLGIQRPRIVEELCVGCGICQNKCPVTPKRAIRVSARVSDRTKVSSGRAP